MEKDLLRSWGGLIALYTWLHASLDLNDDRWAFWVCKIMIVYTSHVRVYNEDMQFDSVQISNSPRYSPQLLQFLAWKTEMVYKARANAQQASE